MCLRFVQAYKSKWINCMCCTHWDTEDFVCVDKAEQDTRERVRSFDEFERLMVTSRTVVGLV